MKLMNIMVSILYFCIKSRGKAQLILISIIYVRAACGQLPVLLALAEAGLVAIVAESLKLGLGRVVLTDGRINIKS